MSRFIDKLVSQVVPQSIGFRVKPAALAKPKLLLIASLAQSNFDGVADYVAGADAGLLPVSESSSGAKAIKEVVQAVPDIPWGGRLRDFGREEITQIVNAGCDFVVFPPASTALAILQDDKVGKILEIEVSLNEGLLRAVDKLSVDAVLIGDEQEKEQFLTWHHLMYFQYCADLLTKPMLASVPENVMPSELQALWVAGVDGVAVKVGFEEPAGKVMKLRQMIDGLTLPSQRKRGKSAALLPYVGGRVGTVTEEPEEE
jgi:hypothetical protein